MSRPYHFGAVLRARGNARPTTLNQSRLVKRGEHLLAVGLEFQFFGGQQSASPAVKLSPQNAGQSHKSIATNRERCWAS